MSWESITGDGGGAPAPAPPSTGGSGAPSSGFSFNLDEALARLDSGEPPPPPAPFAPAVGVDDDLPPSGAAPLAPAVEPLPAIAEATPVLPGPAATLATPVLATPVLASPVLDAAPSAPAAAAPTATVPTLAPAAPAPVVPAPVVPQPAYVPPPVAPVPPAVVGAGARPRSKKRKRGHPFRNTVLVLLLLGGVVAGALVFGRSYLFPDEWDEDLVPLVDDLESRTGLEFGEPVLVEVVPAVDHGTAVVDAAFGADWAAQIPRWRAVGLVSGEPDQAAIAAAVARWLPATPDPVTGDISRSDGVVGPARTDAITEALGLVLLDQQLADDASSSSAPASADTSTATSGPPATSPTATAPSATAVADDLGRRATLTYQARVAADTLDRSADPAVLAPLPAPVLHHLLAADRLGEALVRAGGVDPATDPIADVLAMPPSGVLARASVPAVAAPAPELAVGDTADGTGTPWGADRWYLALAAYLPADTAAAAADVIAADLVTPAVRGTQECVYATFTPRDADAAPVLQLSLAAWVLAAPPEAGASSSVLADGTQQLVACDPGATTTVLPRGGVVDELLARQLARIAG